MFYCQPLIAHQNIAVQPEQRWGRLHVYCKKELAGDCNHSWPNLECIRSKRHVVIVGATHCDSMAVATPFVAADHYSALRRVRGASRNQASLRHSAFIREGVAKAPIARFSKPFT